jgi:5'-nucleotidase / UDP-sugar diphosphatase
MIWRACAMLVWTLAAVLWLAGCPEQVQPKRVNGQLKLTLLHTADVHSRLFPYALQITQIDATLGLGVAGEVATVGGAARMAHVIHRERARADRVLHIDGGDCFQGAPVFNFFNGEAEIRALSMMGVDAQVIANHEFDAGAVNARIQYQKWATFPVLAANYLLDPPALEGSPDLDNVLVPFKTFNLRGLKVAVIGMANLSSLSSLYEKPNRLGVLPLETIDVAQGYVDLLRPLVDVIVFVTHLGLNADEEMIRRTTGIDIVLGGHNHIVLSPPKVVEDCSFSEDTGETCTTDAECPQRARCDDGRCRANYIRLRDKHGELTERRYCRPRRVVLAHSGAFAKYVGRLDLVVSNQQEDIPWEYDRVNGFEVITHQFLLTPLKSDVALARNVAELLEPYKNELDTLVDLDLLVGFAPDGSRRFGTGGGDSPLGNLIATGMWRRLGIESDFSLTNTTGIRADMVPGPVTVEQMFNIFPFDNSISKMQLSGVEVQELFDFVARRSAGRGCSTQVQIAGARVVLGCSECSRQPTQACSSPAGCPPGAACVDGRCPLRCATENDCPTGARCEAERCVVKACAEQIYIGSTEIPCISDSDCGGLQNACDLGVSDREKRGRCRLPIDPTGSYELATSTYLAGGGSGFVVLKKNTTQLDTKIQQRDALIDWVRGGVPCGYDKNNGPDGLLACTTDADCRRLEGAYVCACPENASEQAGVCVSNGACGERGRCVLAACRQGVAEFFRQSCASPDTAVAIASCTTTRSPCELGGEQCKFLACIDRGLGSFSDARVLMVGR